MMKLFSAGVSLALLPAIVCADPLPSWEGESETQIIDFVQSVTDPKSEDYVIPSDRIAVFDNDGTLWGEQPVYFQLIYAVDQVAKMAESDPSILTSDALKAAAEGDYEALMATGKEGLIEVLKITHSGMTVESFQASVAEWLASATHPKTDLPYNKMTYQPMVELLRYLRDEGFKTYIVSGGGIHFMRVFTQEAYGIPTEQVIGTYTETEYHVTDGVPQIVKAPAIGFVDDKEGKPINIERIIGKRPIIAGGNSDGDFAMLEWSTAGEGPRLGILVHHTDAEREWAYDREGHVGVLNRGLDEAAERGWVLVDMANDWSRIFTGSK
ncbi:haloacid dehalogenase-like hydrolase [Roseovarius albus]|uniref:Haloacid dehalogenase-like hydrolase n=2 Tax=Roseovarius albus TaxID=1247867 RepID=A0A1X7A1B9_9RHOB|nr:haloacid dehalogenase-like hydrolase [Roseovarius albus]